MRGIPFGDAARLRPAARRTAFLAALLAIVVGVAALAVNVAARRSEPARVSLLPAGASVVVVLDLSLSIPEVAYERMRNAMTELAASDARVGLVLFSDIAYELLPPGTPSGELRPLLRFLVVPELGPPVTPWTSAFSAGTRISSALELAQYMLVRDKIRNPSILLVSDLETAPEDVPLLARTVDSLRRSDIRMEVAALGPSSDAQRLFGGLLADSPFVLPSEKGEEPRPTSESTYGLPRTLLFLGALLFAALAAHERFGARLALPLAPRPARRSA